MKKCFLYSAIVLLTGMVACNSGSSNEAASTDSTTVQTDTSHTMKMETVSALPTIPADASVFFKSPKNGETVTSPVKVQMGVKGMSVDSAGAVKPNSGHFHILIDAGDSITSGVIIPKDSAHLHYGNAQQETSLTLTPGKHTLTLQFADGAHRSYGSKLASTITIDVKK
ncbi:MAG TPA: DUF4399 domain-containing protein [Hanamia sp.]